MNNEAKENFENQFKTICQDKLPLPIDILVYGHKLHIPLALFHPNVDIESIRYKTDTVEIERKDEIELEYSINKSKKTIDNKKKIGKVAKFNFSDLCEKALGSADYIDLAEKFECIFINDIPVLNLNKRNEIRRFITMIDVFYENNVLLIVCADQPANKLFQFSKEDVSNGHFDEESSN